jgi:7,8-dihydroneopterin aldolase/epimerase/oxygenase
LAASDRLDCIRISRWSVQAAIGAYDHEKLGTQELVLNLSLWGDFRRAAASDALADALDYAALKSAVEAWLDGQRWNLLEAFGDALCRFVLDHPAVRRVELTVEKPAAQAPALVSYTLTRSK